MGYSQAGFDILGIDIVDQPNYPFEFQQADALDVLTYWPLDRVAAIHASPPCQFHTSLARGNNGNQSDYPDLIAPTRDRILSTGLPYVIENVPGAPLHNPITLCGEMFGLNVIRHRRFESDLFLWQLEHEPHTGRVAGMRHGEWFEGPYFQVYGCGGGKGSLQEWRTAMGIDWAKTRVELAEAIPPAYTEYIGAQLIEACECAAVHPMRR